jgi:hypothetical protein
MDVGRVVGDGLNRPVNLSDQMADLRAAVGTLVGQHRGADLPGVGVRSEISMFQARCRLVLRFSYSRSPESQNCLPVLSTSRCTGVHPTFGRGTSDVSTKRLRAALFGTGRSRPSNCRTEPMRITAR